MELVYGRRPVAEVLEGPRHTHKVYITAAGRTDDSLQALLSAARRRNIAVVETTRDEMDRRLGDVVHQGVAAEVSPYMYAELADVLGRLEGRSDGLIVVLDKVTDPQNLGAVIRTAAAAGANGILVGKKRSAAVTPAVVKVSAGLTEKAAIVRTNLSDALIRLKEGGFWIVGADSAGGRRHWDLDLTGKIAVVMGSESRGLSRLVRERCDWLAALPLAPGVDSLNVSAAAAVFIYEVLRQRGTV